MCVWKCASMFLFAVTWILSVLAGRQKPLCQARPAGLGFEGDRRRVPRRVRQSKPPHAIPLLAWCRAESGLNPPSTESDAMSRPVRPVSSRNVQLTARLVAICADEGRFGATYVPTAGPIGGSPHRSAEVAKPETRSGRRTVRSRQLPAVIARSTTGSTRHRPDCADGSSRNPQKTTAQ